MKTPVARKLPSGSWQVRVTVNGETKSITRPTKREAEKEAAAIKIGAAEIESSEITWGQAAENYINAGEGKLSPSTIKRYRAIQKNRFENLKYREIHSISRSQWQKAIDKVAETHSPKTVKNEWRFVSSVLHANSVEPPQIVLEKVIPPDLSFPHL